MKTKEEAEKFIELQFKRLDDNKDNYNKLKACWHYGRLDLKLLLEYIYEQDD